MALPRRPTVLSPIAKRHVIRDCNNKIITARTLKDNLNLNCSVHTVQRVIAATLSKKSKILKPKPILKPVHIIGS